MTTFLALGVGIWIGASAAVAVDFILMRIRESRKISLMASEDAGIISITDEDGKKHEFVLVDSFEFEGSEYCILGVTEEGQEDEALVMKYDGETLVTIESQAEFEKVVAFIEENKI